MYKKICIIFVLLIGLVCVFCVYNHLTDENKTEETISYNTNADIYSIEIIYEGILRIDRGVINIDFTTNEMIFESSNNSITKYKLNDSHKIINFIKDNALHSDWDKDMIEPPSDVTVMLPIGDNVYRLLWRITVVTSEDEYVFCNYEKYPYYWYELIDLICEETGIPRRIVGIY